MRILVVEDEKHLNNILCKKLSSEGYSVDSALDGNSALSNILATDYDGIVLDITLPGISGFEILSKMRASGNSTPVLVLTARDAVEDKVTGLDLGAEDYLTKPFSFEELMARIRVLTRKKSGTSRNIHELADLVVDCQKRFVSRGGVEIPLSSKEFSILEYMIMNKNIVLSRDKIEEHIWSYEYEGASNMIDVYIRYLRKKIDENYSEKLIHTVRGVGYVLRSEK